MLPRRTISRVFTAGIGFCTCALAACAATSLSPGPGATTVPGEADTVINRRVRPDTETVTLRGTLVALGTSDSSPGGAVFGEISILYTVTTQR